MLASAARVCSPLLSGGAFRWARAGYQREVLGPQGGGSCLRLPRDSLAGEARLRHPHGASPWGGPGALPGGMFRWPVRIASMKCGPHEKGAPA
eukprot:9088766-Pyramimonas_sp.AAC.1